VGDRLVLRERPHPRWTLTRIAEVLYRRGIEPALLEEVLALPLVPSWRLLFERRLASGQVENWEKRLQGAP
jgi:MOSC domain-containing protein YiiM